MAPTLPLSRYPPPLPWDVSPLGRLFDDGSIAWEPAVLPPEGPCLLVLWDPAARPQFRARRGELRRLGRSWRWSGEETGGAWIVLVVPAEDARETFR